MTSTTGIPDLFARIANASAEAVRALAKQMQAVYVASIRTDALSYGGRSRRTARRAHRKALKQGRR